MHTVKPALRRLFQVRILFLVRIVDVDHFLCLLFGLLGRIHEGLTSFANIAVARVNIGSVLTQIIRLY